MLAHVEQKKGALGRSEHELQCVASLRLTLAIGIPKKRAQENRVAALGFGFGVCPCHGYGR